MRSPHNLGKRFLNLYKFGCQQSRFRVEDEIITGVFTSFCLSIGIVSPDDLIESAFASIANHGATDFLGYRNPTPGFAALRLENECRKERRMKPFTLIVDPAELLIILQLLGL